MGLSALFDLLRQENIAAMRSRGFPERLDVIDVDSIGEPAFVVGTDGVVVACNDDASLLFGRPANEVIGRKCYSVVRGCVPSGELACAANCPLIQGLGVLPGPPAVELVVRGGGRPSARHLVNVQHIPLSNVRGGPSGLLHILTIAGPPEALG